MKKRTARKDIQPRTILPLSSDELRAVNGGSRDAYFIKVDRDTTTG